MTSKRYELIGCKVVRPDVILDSILKYFKGIGNYKESKDVEYDQSDRRGDIEKALNFCVLVHLGYEVPPIVEKMVVDGFEVALDTFTGDWWKTDRGGATFDRSSPEFHITRWVKSLHQGMLLGILANRWDDVRKIAAWLDPALALRYAKFTEYQLYASIAARSCGVDQAERERLESNLRRYAKTADYELILRTWFAILDQDQNIFEKALIDILDIFVDNDDPDCPMPYIVGIIESLMTHTAVDLGMKYPDLPEKHAAVLLTRESLGLKPS